MELKFNKLGLSKEVNQAIELLGYDNPSKIQEQIIPEILAGTDVIGQAQTGTGKTLAYAASMLSKMNVSTNNVKAIVLVPTRELAIQVCNEFHSLNRMSGFDVLAIYGGSNIDIQIKQLKKGVDIVVGTPGRVIDLLKRKKLQLDNLEYFVLDEADEMLNMGFLSDIEEILNKTSKEQQVLLFSATMPKEIMKLSKKYMSENRKHIHVEEKSKTALTVKQSFSYVTEAIRNEALFRILDQYSNSRGIIFCQRKREVDELIRELNDRNFSAEAIHGDIEQSTRIRRIEGFKKHKFQFLIATDVAARGIHIDGVEIVINYRLPEDVESYIHRIGRTGRAGALGQAKSLITHKEYSMISRIEKIAQCKIEEVALPSRETIMNSKSNQVIELIEKIRKKSKNYSIEYFKDKDSEELKQIASILFNLQLKSLIGSNLDQDLSVEKSKKRKSGKSKEGTTRVFIPIGTKDNLKMGSLLDYLKKETGIRKENFSRIEVLSKFSFFNIDNKQLPILKKKLDKKRFKGRTLHIEEAKSK